MRGIVDLENMLDGYGLRGKRKHRDALWGWEILEAAQGAAQFNAKGPAGIASVLDLASPPKGRKGTPARRRMGVDDLRD